MSDRYSFVVNGRPVSVTADGTAPLLSVLRDELGLRGTKFGCGTEQCGACMVLIDGKPEYSCSREVATVAGKVRHHRRGPAPATARCIRCSRRCSTSRPASAATACPAS